jgi:flagellar biosynthetic protein FliR
MPLQQFLPAELFVVLAVFARLGAAFSTLPAFGENFVPARIRLLIALGVTLVVAPIVRDGIPPQPGNPLDLAAFLLFEISVGFFFGMLARLLITALDTAGTIISFQVGLSAATVFNPGLAQQSTVTGTALSLAGITAVLVSDLHHLVIMGLVDTYTLFEPGVAPDYGGMTDLFARHVAESFRIGFQLAMPFVVVVLLFNVALGLTSRLIPQVQIFFVGVPIQLAGGMLMLMLTASAMLLWFLGYFQDSIQGFLKPK